MLVNRIECSYMWVAPPFLQQRNEKERFLEIKSWAKIQWKPESKVWESLRGSEWMRVECESLKLTPRPLFKERLAGHRWEKPSTTASDRWKRLGPLAVGRGRPTLGFGRTLGGPPYWQPGPTGLLTVICFLNFGAGQTLLQNDVQIYFPKDFNAPKYFWIFVKTKKVLEKFLACMSVLKIQIWSRKNWKSQGKHNGGK